MDIWRLPKSAVIGRTEYQMNTDFRDVLEIIGFLNDESKPEYLRWQIALGLFYDREIPEAYQVQAMEYLSEFLSYGETDAKPGPKLMDWSQDANAIIGDINKVAGTEVRSAEYIHWWTFLSYFNGIGEGRLSTIISIRSKLRGGKKLEKWEEDFYKKNKRKIDLQKAYTPEDAATQEYFNKWL